MSNMQKLSNGTSNQQLFANTITTFMNSQGLYSRLFQAINNLDEDRYNTLCEAIDKQNFKDTVDVVLWIEC